MPQFFPQKLLATSLPSAQNVGDETVALEMSLEKIVEIPAWVESAPSDRPGDTMDDPPFGYIPLNPKKPCAWHQQTLGLLSFNMRGEQVQALPSGRINNVDLRQQVQLGGKMRDIAVATQREHDSLAFYEIDAAGKMLNTRIRRLT
ncbi:hypothetical protein LFREDSHE_24710 [Shewanella baltica]